MVRWFDPVQLLGTALQVVVAGFFGAYADKREIQVALAPDAAPDAESYADSDELWFDYVADLGDGFESTYTIAYLLASPELTIASGQERLTTRRGRLLVMGGDEVYPTAKRTEYEDRMIGPYRAALPWTAEQTTPHLYVIPGNHDWYDGLTSFIRFFCQKRYVGGWLTRQSRSYFAFRLAHGWWLWAIDIQFDAYIDEPQLEYFRKARALLARGERILLVTGKPSWTKGAHQPSYENLKFFEDEMIKGSGASVAVWLSGDQHHYCRYEDEAGRQRITSGGGGAYLFPTHHMVERLELDEPQGSATYELRAVYPSKKQSRRLRLGAPLFLGLRNWRLSRVIALVYFLVAVLLQIPVRDAVPASGRVSFGEVFGLWGDVIASQWLIYAALVLVVPMFLFAASRAVWGRLALAVPHALAHLGLVSLFVALSAWVLPGDWSKRFGLALAALAAIVAAPGGMAILGAYLAVGDMLVGGKLERFPNEAFSAQGIKGYKNFLRFHLAADGALTIYPVGLDRVFRRSRLELRPEGAPGDPWFEPEPGGEVEPRLLEDRPIVIPAPSLDAVSPPGVAST